MTAEITELWVENSQKINCRDVTSIYSGGKSTQLASQLAIIMNPQDDFDMNIELSSLVTLLMNQQPTRKSKKIFTYFRLSWCCSHNRAHIPLALALVYSRLFLFSCFELPFLYPFLGKLLLARAHLGKLWGAVTEKNYKTHKYNARSLLQH